MTDDDIQPTIRRISIYRQLSDVLKSKRKSYHQLSSTHSTFTFPWNCTLTEVNSLSSKEDLNNKTSSLVKQKSISYDDITYLSNNEDEQLIKQNGLSLYLLVLYFNII